MEKDQDFWLTRRLKELGKTQAGLAEVIGVDRARISEIKTGRWSIQTHQIKTAAAYLEFDRTAFLDFISGDITEEELWSYKAPETVSAEDMALLRAVKSIASREAQEETSQNTVKPAKIPANNRERE